MSKIEQSMEKALKLRGKPAPIRKNDLLPPDVPNDISGFYENGEEQQAHLRDYLEVLLRRKWVVLSFLITVVITVTIASLFMTPLYKAQTVLQLISGKTDLVEFRDVYKERNNLETQYKIMKSRSLAERIAEKIPPEHLPKSYERGFLSAISSILPFSDGQDKDPVKRKKLSPGIIMGGMEVQPVKKTHLVNINFVSEDPVFATYAANMVADEYMRYASEIKLKTSELGEERLRKEVEDMRANLEASEKDLNDYIARSQFIITRNDKDYENLLSNKLSLLNNALDQATSERISTEAIYEEVKNSGIDYKIVLEDPLMRQLTQDYIKLESEYFNLLMIHKPEYPKMVQLKDQIEKLKDRIEVEEQKVINTLHSDYTLALKKEKLLSAAIGDLRQEVNDFQKNMIHFFRLKREVETNREIYDSLLQRLKEVDVTTALTESDVRVLDRAQVPGIPFKPRLSYNIVLSLIFGLFGGVFLAFFAEYFDNTIKTDKEVEKITRLPVLGSVPISKTNSQDLVKINASDNIAFSEAFRSIGTRIQFSNTSKLPRKLLITSPMEQEGKTLISASIAMSLISSQEKGIIIDGDLRRPDVHTLFDLDNSVGLSSFLSGTSEFEGLIKESPYAGLDVITAGPLSPNPSALLSSSRMRELIDVLSATYDYIIFDAAPVLGMSDSMIMSTILDSVILVVKANKTPRDALAQTHKALTSVNANTLGVVLNGVKMKKRYAYSNYYCSPYLNDNGKKKELVR
jgi:capsular exopolysaccharide synthesis family protein